MAVAAFEQIFEPKHELIGRYEVGGVAHLQSVDQDMLDAAALVDCFGRSDWVPADLLPSVQAEREKRDVESLSILEDRMDLLRQGKGNEVPYAFDVLTTARKVLSAEQVHGKNSQEYCKQMKGLQLDSKRHIAEAERRLTYLYAAEVEQVYDPNLDSYVYGGYVLDEVVTDGLSPVGSEKIGVEVLIADRREEFTAKSVGKLGSLILKQSGVEKPENQVRMMTISQIDNSPQTMIRSLRFDPQTGSRYQEQVGFTKQYITHEVIVEGLKQKGLIEEDAQPTEIEVLGMQALSFDGEGVLGFMPTLDAIASEKSGKNIFMGEVVADGHPKDYVAVPKQALEREKTQEHESKLLLNEVLRLAKEDVDSCLANILIDKFVTDMLLDKTAENPAAAKDIFGAETAQKIETAMQLREQGRINEADTMINEARTNAPQATVCSGGSCGLKEVDPTNGEDLAAAKRLGIKSSEMKDKMVSYDKAWCPDCKVTKKMYYNAKTADATCTCGSSKIGNKTVSGNPKKADKKQPIFALAA